MAAIDIAIAVESDGWPGSDELESLSARVVAAAVDYLEAETAQPFPASAPELSIVFTGDEAMRRLNAAWRGKDSPTNVLSFPAAAMQPGEMPGPMLGDVVLAYQTITGEAAAMGVPFEAHLTHLVVHGFLHLIGYDHGDEQQATEMEGLETRILATLGLSDPYADNDPERTPKRR